MAQIPHAHPGLICPLHKKDVSKVCHTCPWWCSVDLVNRNTGDKVDEWRCAISLLPFIMLENAYQARHAGEATEGMRDEIIKRMDNPVPIPFRKFLE